MTAYIMDASGAWVPQDDYSWEANHPHPSGWHPQLNDMGTDLVSRALADCQRGMTGSVREQAPGVYVVTFDELRADPQALQQSLAHYLHCGRVDLRIDYDVHRLLVIAYEAE